MLKKKAIYQNNDFIEKSPAVKPFPPDVQKPRLPRGGRCPVNKLLQDICQQIAAGTSRR